MANFQQFEIWQDSEGRWEYIASFLNFDTAYAMTKNRGNQVRLLRVTYDNGQPVAQEVIAELGTTRVQP